jgi:hypothetical protein
MKRLLTVGLFSILAGLAPSLPAAQGTKLAFDTYAGYFVLNTFEPDAAQSFAVIDDQEQFNKLFGVAMVMGDRSHRLAKHALKSKLVLAAIERGRAVWEFKVESVTVDGGVVTLRYAATARKSDSATFSCPLIVSIPRGDYTVVRFVKNKKLVKTVPVKSRDASPRSRP